VYLENSKPREGVLWHNAQVHLRANQTKCERSELPNIARLVQRTLYDTGPWRGDVCYHPVRTPLPFALENSVMDRARALAEMSGPPVGPMVRTLNPFRPSEIM
jgi:hypothetical protein